MSASLKLIFKSINDSVWVCQAENKMYVHLCVLCVFCACFAHVLHVQPSLPYSVTKAGEQSSVGFITTYFLLSGGTSP